MTDEIQDVVRDESRGRGGFGTEAVKLFRGIGLEEPIPELRGYPVKLPEFD